MVRRRALLASVLVLLAGCGGSEPAPSEPAAAETAARAASTPCGDPFGEPPQGFEYVPADAETASNSASALGLDPADIDMRLISQADLSLGSVIAVSGVDPDRYATSVVETAKASGADVSRGAAGFAVVPLPSGTEVAVGVKACVAVLISGVDPNAVRFLAAGIFGAP